MATFEFDPGLGSVKDELRQRVGDTDGQPQWFLADETYMAYSAKYSFDEAAAQAAESIGAMCAQLATQVQQRNLRIGFQARSEKMFELADRIRNLAAPDPTSPKNPGALGGVMASPDLSQYALGLPLTDPNNSGVLIPPTILDGF